MKRKNPTVPDHPPVGTLSIPDSPCQWWHMDVVGPLVKSKAGNRYLPVLTDPFSKWPEALAMPDQSAKTTADNIYQGIVCRYCSDYVMLLLEVGQTDKRTRMSANTCFWSERA